MRQPDDMYYLRDTHTLARHCGGVYLCRRVAWESFCYSQQRAPSDSVSLSHCRFHAKLDLCFGAIDIVILISILSNYSGPGSSWLGHSGPAGFSIDT